MGIVNLNNFWRKKNISVKLKLPYENDYVDMGI